MKITCKECGTKIHDTYLERLMHVATFHPAYFMRTVTGMADQMRRFGFTIGDVIAKGKQVNG